MALRYEVESFKHFLTNIEHFFRSINLPKARYSEFDFHTPIHDTTYSLDQFFKELRNLEPFFVISSSSLEEDINSILGDVFDLNDFITKLKIQEIEKINPATLEIKIRNNNPGVLDRTIHRIFVKITNELENLKPKQLIAILQIHPIAAEELRELEEIKENAGNILTSLKETQKEAEDIFVDKVINSLNKSYQEELNKFESEYNQNRCYYRWSLGVFAGLTIMMCFLHDNISDLKDIFKNIPYYFLYIPIILMIRNLGLKDKNLFMLIQNYKHKVS